MTNKIPPYKTPAGVEIGKNYTPPRRREFSVDEERIQRLLIGSPLDDGFEDLGRMAAICLAILLGLILFVTWVTI